MGTRRKRGGLVGTVTPLHTTKPPSHPGSRRTSSVGTEGIAATYKKPLEFDKDPKFNISPKSPGVKRDKQALQGREGIAAFAEEQRGIDAQATNEFNSLKARTMKRLNGARRRRTRRHRR